MRKLEALEDAVSVAAQVLAGEVQPNLGCTMIAAVSENLKSPKDLLIFQLLAHEQYEHEHLGITADSCVPDILEACRSLLEIHRAKVA
jgi:hypothetical protein